MCTEEYGRYNQTQKAEGLDLINLLAPKPGEKVLDLGCGIGNLTKILAQRVAPGQVVGIDPDEKRIKVAKKEQAADNIKYMISGSDNMPGENYDIIYSNYVLHWIPNNKDIFGPIARLLKKGGRFAFHTLDVISKEICDRYYGWSDKNWSSLNNTVSGLTENDVKTLAEENHLEVKLLESGSFKIEYENVEDFIQGHLVHGTTSRDLYDEKKLSDFFGDGKITVLLPRVSAILQKL